MRKILLFFFSHRTLALIRWDIHFLKIRFNNALFNKPGRLLKRIKKAKGKLYLNLGSGPRGLSSDNWVNIDGFMDTNVHYLCDFNRPFPFANETFDGIFCEHVLEHFTYDDGRALMKECKRILKQGGVLRIIVPDGKKIQTWYLNDPEGIVKYKEVRSGFPMEAVNNFFYQRYEHQCIYDATLLVDSLLQAGYQSAGETSFGETGTGVRDIILDDSKYNKESLYVEAVK
ncbi:MAG: methyltransferase domain-containing protein [Chitinophagaceae bacterium]|nr:methyltransferase domain-containing protein [Chitinophagaceae bacterium]